MRIAIASSEAAPFSKTGGLADVTGTLFREYVKMGLEAYLFVPLYRQTDERFKEDLRDTGLVFDISLGRAARRCTVFTLQDNTEILGNRAGGKKPGGTSPCRVFFIGNDEFFGRSELYGTASGDYPDNDQRFIFFQKSVLEICNKLDLTVDIMHCNDWQTGLIPLYLKMLRGKSPALKKTVSVLTIHNLGYQGLFPPQTLETAGVGMDIFTPEGLEFYGKVNFLKAGIIWADLITTVSKTYAKEILTPDSGFGLDGILRKRSDSIIGIRNGINYSEWNPHTDKFIPHTYGKSRLEGKTACKNELIKRCSLSGNASLPLMCYIGRLSTQKGIDILSEAIAALMSEGINIIVVGRGEGPYYNMLDSMRSRFAGNFHFHIGFDEPFAHFVYAGSDIFLMPSKYEPCGLGQMIAMHYGTIPVARNTGGISDTVEEGKTGFLFNEYSTGAFTNSINTALGKYSSKKAWGDIVRNAMGADFSWKESVKIYLTAYKNAIIAKN